MKQCLGIDVAKHEHVLGSRYESGEQHGKAFAFANDEKGFSSLLERLRELEAAPEDSLVVMESTGHYWMALWEFLVAHGYEVAVVNPVLTDAFRKDDTQPELDDLLSDKHSATARAILNEYGTAAKVAAADIRTLTKTVREASRGRHGRAKAEEVKEAAKKSVGTALAFEASHIASLVEHLDAEMANLDAEIARLLDPEVGALLRTIPGIGPVCAAAIAAEVGDPDRFDDPKKLMAYAGMDSTKFQSGKFDGDEQHMSKRGSAPLRNALMTAADGARRFDPYFGDYYDSLRARGKHHYVAVSGCARKLCGVILAVLRERRPYEPRPSIQSQQKQSDRS